MRAALLSAFAFTVWPWVAATVLLLGLWTALVALAVRYTVLSDMERWWLSHLDEAARHEVWVRDQEIARLTDALAEAQAAVGDHKAVVKLFERAGEKAKEVAR